MKGTATWRSRHLVLLAHGAVVEVDARVHEAHVC
jgi:hypothetical protein